MGARLLEPETTVEATVAPRPGRAGRQWRLLAVCTAVLIVCFAKPLYDLVRLAAHSGLFSYILLVPAVSVYLAWEKRTLICADETLIEGKDRKRLNLGWAFWTAVVAGAGLLGGYWLVRRWGVELGSLDVLAWKTVAFFVLFVAVCLACLERATARKLAFPIGFLIFLVPFPERVVTWLETLLQHGSADVAAWMFSLVGTPFVRDGVAFQLPGFGLTVARECSGIHSSLVLFITSLVAGQLFLRTPWKRALFAAAVIPLGLLRNGFRIVTIGELCVQLDPKWIDSPLHHRGGPIFFAISMVPFLILLWWLRRTDVPGKNKPQMDTDGH